MAEHGFWSYAQRQPEAPALIDPSAREWTRGELLAQCNQMVHGLRELGLEHGDSLALCTPNCAEFFVSYMACTQAGWYLTPINWHLAASEVAYIVRDSGAKAFVGHERLGVTCAQAADEIDFPKQARFALGEIPGFRPFADLTRDRSPKPPENRCTGSVMNYTSGTTGKPKGVRRPLPPSELEPDLIGGMMAGFLAMFGIQPEDDNVHLVGSPLYHTAVLVFSSASLHYGHTVVLMDKWTPDRMLQLIDQYRATTSHMVPTQFHRMLALPKATRAKYDCSSTRRMIHAAAPCPPDIKRRMIEWWGMSIWEYYGATEGGGTLVGPEEWLRYPGTVGRPWPTAEIRIFADDETELPAGERGTVYMKMGESTRFEYKGDKEKTRKNRISIPEGEFFTVGDIGYLNEDGYLFLCDRKIDMIISGGVNIYPAEIENSFLLHPKVGDVAVFGIPHEDWGEEIKAVVEPAEGVEGNDALTQELFEFLKDKLGKFKTPKSIDYVDEMPRDPNGKLYKRKLRDPYWEGQERAI